MSRICFDRPHHVLGCWTLWPSDLGFLYQRFSSPVATKPVSSETSKAERRSSGVHSSIRDSWSIAFSGYPRGPRVGCETKCPRHTFALTNQLRLALEPEGLENPTVTAREDPRDGRIRSETLKLFVVSDVGRRSTLPSSTRSKQWWQSSWLRSAVPSPASYLWQLKPRRTVRRGRAWSRRLPPHP
jgi:hypothetical protein